MAETGPVERVVVQLDRLATQMHGLQEQLDAFIARRNEAVAERASQHVASIVAAAEKSAAEIRAGAEKDAAAVRERLIDEVQAEVELIRAEAQADAARIRTEAHVYAAHAREEAIAQASAEIQAVCARLSEDLQARARAAVAKIVGGARESAPGEAAASAATRAANWRGEAAASAPTPAATARRHAASAVLESASAQTAARITNEARDAVQELQNAAIVLERSLRNRHAAGAEHQPA